MQLKQRHKWRTGRDSNPYKCIPAHSSTHLNPFKSVTYNSRKFSSVLLCSQTAKKTVKLIGLIRVLGRPSCARSKTNPTQPEYEMNKVFLGGTCNDSTWRDELIPNIQVNYFNPVVDDWSGIAQAEEELEKREHCNIHLYVITSEMTGE